MVWVVSTLLGATWGWALGNDMAGIGVSALLWVPWAALDHAWGYAVSGSALGAALWLKTRAHSAASEPDRLRPHLVRFWRLTGLLLTAGLGPWPAIERAAEAVPEVTGPVRQLAERLTREPNGLQAIGRFCRAIPGPEAEVVATMIDHGFRHGLSGDDVMRQAVDLGDQLGFEADLKRRRGPVWLSVLPAMMLFNVLIVFGLPMGLGMVAQWRSVL